MGSESLARSVSSRIGWELETSPTRGESEHHNHHATNVKGEEPNRFDCASVDKVGGIASEAPELHVRTAP